MIDIDLYWKCFLTKSNSKSDFLLGDFYIYFFKNPGESDYLEHLYKLTYGKEYWENLFAKVKNSSEPKTFQSYQEHDSSENRRSEENY